MLFYRYAKPMSKQKKYWQINNIKMENSELKKVDFKSHMCYHLEGIIQIEVLILIIFY